MIVEDEEENKKNGILFRIQTREREFEERLKRPLDTTFFRYTIGLRVSASLLHDRN